MKEKKTILILILVLTIGIIGLTVAYFSNSTSIDNTFTTRGYGTTTDEDFVSPDNWLPGKTTEKTLTVTNSGNVDEAVRISYAAVVATITRVISNIAPCFIICYRFLRVVKNTCLQAIVENPKIFSAKTVENPKIFSAQTVENPKIFFTKTVENPKFFSAQTVENPKIFFAKNLCNLCNLCDIDDSNVKKKL